MAHPSSAFGHIFIDPTAQDEAFFARVCVLDWPKDLPELMTLDLPDFAEGTWKQIRELFAQHGSPCSSLLDYVGRKSQSATATALFHEANTLRKISGVCADFTAAKCPRCGVTAWECTEISENQVAVKWRCSFCGSGQILRTDKPRLPVSDSRPAIPKEVQREVWRRDAGRCTECGSNENLEFDHIIAVAFGGRNHRSEYSIAV